MKLLIVFLSLMSIISFSNNHNINNARNFKNRIAISDSIPNMDSDRIFDSTSSYYLIANKTEKRVLLKYKTKKMRKEISISFQYPNYSDELFPYNAIGLIKNGTYKKMRYCLLGDSVLILPIIGINNLLSTYIINLKNGEVIGDSDGLRSSLNLVWVYIKNGNPYFITSDTPLLVDNDKLNKYTIITSRIGCNTIQEIKRSLILLKIEDHDNIKSEYKAIHGFLIKTGT